MVHLKAENRLASQCSPVALDCPSWNPPPGNGFYTFASAPKPILPKPRYRDNVRVPRGIHDYFNMMFDPRVRRGNPAKSSMFPTCKPLATGQGQSESECRRPPPKCPQKGYKNAPLLNCYLNRVGQEQGQGEGEGPRVSKDIQTDPTDLYNPVDDVTFADFSSQTSPKGLSPSINHSLSGHDGSYGFFTKSKVGTDATTQVGPGELFDFDCEVRPLVETITALILEQSLLEVMEEEELFAIRAQQAEFTERRNKEAEGLVKLQEAEKRLREESELLDGAMKKSPLFATDPALQGLENEGLGVELKPEDLHCTLVPWLNHQVELEMARRHVAYSLLDEIIFSSCQKKAKDYAQF